MTITADSCKRGGQTGQILMGRKTSSGMTAGHKQNI